jgi:hypothetical protein
MSDVLFKKKYFLLRGETVGLEHLFVIREREKVLPM